MPIPATNLYPDSNTIRLSHVCLNVKDLAASKTFYTEILGLQVTDETDEHIYLRAMEERGHHCIILQKSEQPGTVEVMGFKTFDEDDLDKAETYFQSKGRPNEWIERAYQGKTLLTSDNMGIPLEFYHKMDRLPSIHQNTPCIAVQSLYGLTTLTAFRTMWMPRLRSTAILGSA